MRVPRLGVAIFGFACSGLLSGEALRITTTPSHTPTPTTTPTPTGTPAGPAQRPTPWAVHGPEILVPVTTAGDQRGPSVALGADAGLVVVWKSDGGDGDAGAVLGRRFDASGSPLGGEFLVNTTTTGDQSLPAVASDRDGNFVVVWTSPDLGGGTDVLGRRYDAGGAPLSGEFQVNSYTTGGQSSPRVAMHENGFVVVWASAPISGQPGQDGDEDGIFGQRYSVNGVPNGSEFPVNTHTTGEQKAPSVSTDSFSGNFNVVWESRGQDGDLGGIFGQRFTSDGSPFGGEFQVNAHTAGDQTGPDVSGYFDFIVVWSSEGEDGSASGVFGHQFSWLTPVTSDFPVNLQTAGSQTHPRVSADASYYRSFIVSWESSGQDDPADPVSTGIYARRFNNSPYPTAVSFLVQPVAQGVEYQINAQTTGSQSFPALALSNDGRFVVAWQSSNQDGSGEGVYAERFQFPRPVKMQIDESPASGGASNSNGVLEPGEQVTVAPSWRNSLSPSPLPLFGSADNLTGAAGPTRTIDDSLADYGTILPDATNDCATATGNCYEVTVSGSRPSLHWDDTLDEHPESTGLLGPAGSAPVLTKTWALHVGGSFADVPQDTFYPYVENLLHNGVTAGGGCGSGLFCAEDEVLRQQMAVFLLKSVLGPQYSPPPATGSVFADVAASNPFAPWIEELARRQITGGCTAPPPPELPSYCPTAPVNRQQMAVFLLKARWGFDITLGWTCQEMFEDVPCSSPFMRYVEYLAYSGITGGCQVSPSLYCPTDPTKRRQMAVFLVKTFGLELYGPD
jgi:hypothetical protein